MKTVITLIACIFLMFTKTWAQPYQSIFGTDSTRWDIIELPHIVPPEATYFYNKINSNSKVVLGNQEYHLCTFWMGQHSVYIREDLSIGKVWVKEHADSTEYLLFDFSLNAGDTFEIRSMEPHANSITKIIVDSTNIINGRKWIYLGWPIQGDTLSNISGLPFRLHRFMVEGIGSNVAKISNQTTYGNKSFGQYLLCAFKDGIKNMNYINEMNSGKCVEDSFNNVSKYMLPLIQLYPNPIKDLLYLEQLPPLPHTISIYDVLGRKVFSSENTEQQYRINMQHYASGTYIVQIRLKDYTTQNFKIVKQ